MKKRAMTPAQLPHETIQRAIAHMNEDHQDALALYARVLGGVQGVQQARVTAIDAAGFDLLVVTGEGQRQTIRLDFLDPLQDVSEMRAAFVELARHAGKLDGARPAA